MRCPSTKAEAPDILSRTGPIHLSRFLPGIYRNNPASCPSWTTQGLVVTADVALDDGLPLLLRR
jgi:hypothetical protein